MRNYGIAYHVESESFHPDFTISAAYCYSQDNDGFISLPESWTFSWPVIDAHQFQRYGASQVQGLLGGVEDGWQMARSEAIERAIGDVLTMIVCEIIDNRQDNAHWSIYILGPALHKIIGRLASLRPPEQVRIVWICPLPFPQWIVRGANEPVLLPSENVQTESLWEEEPLVITEEMPHIGKARCIRQTLRLWPPVAERAESDQTTWSGKLLWGAMLPKEIVVASGQVDNHMLSQYVNYDLLSQLRPLKGEWESHRDLYDESTDRLTTLEDGTVGWSIQWTTQSDPNILLVG